MEREQDKDKAGLLTLALNWVIWCPRLIATFPDKAERQACYLLCYAAYLHSFAASISFGLSTSVVWGLTVFYAHLLWLGGFLLSVVGKDLAQQYHPKGFYSSWD